MSDIAAELRHATKRIEECDGKIADSTRELHTLEKKRIEVRDNLDEIEKNIAAQHAEIKKWEEEKRRAEHTRSETERRREQEIRRLKDAT
jgi:septal ring factor EnvC (AmiA/AmiB activator)